LLELTQHVGARAALLRQLVVDAVALCVWIQFPQRSFRHEILHSAFVAQVPRFKDRDFVCDMKTATCPLALATFLAPISHSFSASKIGRFCSKAARNCSNWRSYIARTSARGS